MSESNAASGSALLLAAVLLGAFVRFVTEGMGTQVPVTPTEQLVIGGLYRYVRNPMYGDPAPALTQAPAYLSARYAVASA